MTQPTQTTVQLQRQLALLHAGEKEARCGLISHACERLRRLTRKMLRQYPIVHGMEQTDDVLQNAVIRLDRALSEMTPESLLHFFNLASQHIRWELLDLAKRYKSHAQPKVEIDEMPDKDGPNLETWMEVHEAVQALPDEEREIVNLLFYEDLTQGEAAELLGVSRRTVIRRWNSARFLLDQLLEGEMA